MANIIDIDAVIKELNAEYPNDIYALNTEVDLIKRKAHREVIDHLYAIATSNNERKVKK